MASMISCTRRPSRQDTSGVAPLPPGAENVPLAEGEEVPEVANANTGNGGTVNEPEVE